MEGFRDSLRYFLEDVIAPNTDAISLVVFAVFWGLFIYKINSINKNGTAEEKILQRNIILSGVKGLFIIVSLSLFVNVASLVINIVQGNISEFESFDFDLTILAALGVIYYFGALMSLKEYENKPEKRRKLLDDYAKLAKGIMDEDTKDQ